MRRQKTRAITCLLSVGSPPFGRRSDAKLPPTRRHVRSLNYRRYPVGGFSSRRWRSLAGVASLFVKRPEIVKEDPLDFGFCFWMGLDIMARWNNQLRFGTVQV
jgi:hypothetical protein